jgi:Arc/MetJ-type ribon-helix-helix transcriptional regulator
MQISLPDSWAKWVKEQASRAGYPTPDEFVLRLLRQEKDRESGPDAQAMLREALDNGEPGKQTPEFWEEQRSAIDEKLIVAIESGPSTPMTALDWDNIRREVRERRERRNGP